MHWLIQVSGWLYLVLGGEIKPLCERSGKGMLVRVNLCGWLTGPGNSLGGQVDVVRLWSNSKY